MKRILILATTTGYQIRSFAEAAGSLGVRLLFASDRCDQLQDPWFDQAIAVRFQHVERDVDAVVHACGAAPPDGVLAVGDRPVVLAARLNAVWNRPGNPPQAAAASRNKMQARDAFTAAGLPTPSYRVALLGQDAAELGTSVRVSPGYPVVVKPLMLSGSRGVMRANDEEELAASVRRLRALLRATDVRAEREDAHERALVERFIPGAEFAVEAVLTRGVLQPLAIFDKPDPLDGPFFEETIYVTPSRQSTRTQQAIVDTVAAGARALGLWHGPLHAECRVNAEGVYLLEIAARPIGGLCARALRFVDGVSNEATTASLEELLLRQAIGEDVTRYRREPRAAAVMMLPIPGRGVYRGVDGVDAAGAVPGVDGVVITAKPDSVIVPLPEGRSYLGFIFAHGDTATEAEQAVRAAHGQLRFRIEKEIAVI